MAGAARGASGARPDRGRAGVHRRYIVTGGGLAAAMPAVARALLGEPVTHLSTAREWRYGRRGSLAIDVERGLWRDHEAATGGGVLDLIRRECGGDLTAARQWLASNCTGSGTSSPAPVRAMAAKSPDDRPRMAYALGIWHGAHPPQGTPAQAYLASRGLHLALLCDAPRDRIRFAPACPFGPGTRRPAMLALLTDIVTGEPVGIRRTALTADGARARDAFNVKLPHKVLGRAGNAVVRLAGGTRPAAALALCEGVETGLSVIAATGATVWSCPAGTLAKVPVLPGVERLAIYADNDPPGLMAARAVASRWRAAGRQISIETPSRPGADFNDLWMENYSG